MEMIITNLWKVFHCWLMIEHHGRLMGTREFLELISLDFFNDIFSTDTVTPGNIMTLLNEVNDGDPVDTRRCIDLFTIYCFTQEMTIYDLTLPSA